MLSLAIVAFGNEIQKIVNIINQDNCYIKKIITIPTIEAQQVIDLYHDRTVFYDYLPEFAQKEYVDYYIISDIIKAAGTENRIGKELKKYGVLDEQIIDLTYFYSSEVFPLYNILKFCKSHRNYGEFFITGVSHAFAGTDMQAYSYRGINIANTSQDIFIDYELAKLLIRYQNMLKAAIIGVAPFSLHYDLSMSYGVNDGRMHMYYPIIKNMHNYKISEDILKLAFNEGYFGAYDEFSDELQFKQRLFCNSLNKEFEFNDYIAIRDKLSYWDNKEYRNTAVENKNIIEKYILLCKKNNIIPLLVIYPVSSWYNKYFSPKIYDETREFLCNISKKYNIQYRDYSEDSRFLVNDFFDIEHLNCRGAKKISMILNEDLRAIIGGRR